MKLIAFSLLLSTTIACTAASSVDETSTSSEIATAPTVPTNDERICTTECSWRDRCGSQTYAACVPQCLHRYVNQGATLREEYIASVERCFPALACNHTDDACLERWLPNTPVPEENACIIRRAQCGGGSFDNDLCFAIPALTDAARADAKACLTQDCANVGACVKQSLGVN